LLFIRFGTVAQEETMESTAPAGPSGRPHVLRRTYLIDRPFQLNFSLLLLLIAAVNIFFFSMLFFFYDQKVAYDYQNALALDSIPPELRQMSFSLFIKTIVAAIFFETLLVGMLGVFFSHRIAGPLYNMRQRMKEMIAGTYPEKIRLRKDDMLHEFAAEMNTLLQKLRGEMAEEAALLEAVAPAVGDGDQQAKLRAVIERKKSALQKPEKPA
jgi:hypothetical protein